MAAPAALTPEELTGRARSHVVQIEESAAGPRFALHPRALEAFLDLRAAAARAGFDLRPFSTFRDIKTQARIWNRKFRGERPVYDRAGRPRALGALGPEEKIWAILGFSAAPGASRHHWGTEVDVVDGGPVDAGWAVRLLPDETAPGGVFAPLRAWLDGAIAAHGFFRPYDDAPDRGGMFPEPWHLSFAEVATPALEAIDAALLAEAIAPLALEGGAALQARLEEVVTRHVRAIAPPPAGPT